MAKFTPTQRAPARQHALVLTLLAGVLFCYGAWLMFSGRAARSLSHFSNVPSSSSQSNNVRPAKVAEQPAASKSRSTPARTARKGFTKHVVLAALDGDDTTWVDRRLPSWTSSVYTMDDPTAKLTVPANKGRESMVYLTYIVDNYDNLPDVVAFMQGQQYQWHNDDSNKDSATLLARLQIPHVLREGYVNMRCTWSVGCPNEVYLDAADTGFAGLQERSFRDAFVELFPEKAAARQIPEVVSASCCAQFAVSRKMLHGKTKQEWERIRDWLLHTPTEDMISKRTFEYSWHMFFNQSAVHCPDASTCYCKTFGLCDLPDCGKGDCRGMFTFEGVRDMPDDWAPLADFEAAGEHPPPPPILQPHVPDSVAAKRQKVLKALGKIRHHRHTLHRRPMDVPEWTKIWEENEELEQKQQQQSKPVQMKLPMVGTEGDGDDEEGPTIELQTIVIDAPMAFDSIGSLWPRGEDNEDSTNKPERPVINHIVPKAGSRDWERR